MKPDRAEPTPRILVIDDNQAIHEDFRKIFSANGARSAPSAAEQALFGEEAGAPVAAPQLQIDSAYQGQEGLALVQRAIGEGNPYSVAFIDVRMPPGWDGVETTAHIWQEDPDIQVVICTAFSDYSWNEMLTRLGRSDRLVILKKPFDTIEVVQMACALTEKWRLARQSRSTFEGLESRIAERTHGLVEAGERLRESEAQYRLLFDSNPHPMWVCDLETHGFVTVNAAAIEQYGYSRDEFLAMKVGDIRCDDAPEEAGGKPQAAGKRLGLRRHRKRNGSIIDVEVSSDRITFNGRPCELVLAHDVTARKQAEIRITRLNRVYAVLSEINALIVRVDNHDQLFRGACRIAVEAGGFRMALIGVVDRNTLRLVPTASAGVDEDLMEAIKRRMASGAATPDSPVAQVVREKKAFIVGDLDAEPSLLLGEKHRDYGVRSLAMLPLLVSEVVVGVLALYSSESGLFQEDEVKLLTELADDVAFAIDHIDKQERLDYLAYYDELTGLANRRLFLERVAQYMRSNGNGQKVALLLLDLERFKNINDSLGQAAGDELLRQVAAWLTRKMGGASLLARISADHFAVVLPQDKQDGDVAGFLEKAAEALLIHPFHLGDAVLRIATKIGVALFPDDGATADALYRNAEAALKKAKASGERILFYNHAMTEKVAGTLTLENQLRHALDRGEFVLHYQPKVNLASGKVVGAEALIRWNNPRIGLVPPGQFIPVLEETGLIYQVGLWALRKAVEEFLRWRAAGLPAVRIAVNVSPLQLRNRAFIEEIRQAIGSEPNAASGVELEITEGLIMENVRHSIASLEAIRAMGVGVVIDDFGTGFSSLSYLSRLPLDSLKIDRSFVLDMTTGPEGLALVSTIINLAHSLSLKVVAEGIETGEQSRLLRLLNCDEMQGFFFSAGVPADVFEKKFLLPPRSP